jgi:hypothetical protein
MAAAREAFAVGWAEGAGGEAVDPRRRLAAALLAVVREVGDAQGGPGAAKMLTRPQQRPVHQQGSGGKGSVQQTSVQSGPPGAQHTAKG